MDGSSHSNPERQLQDFLIRRESGEDLDFEEFLRLHADVEKELRKLMNQIEEGGIRISDLLPMETEPATANSPGKVLGDYRIIRAIDSGGQGSVYEAEQISLKRRVALKILAPHLSLSDKAVLKFRLEAEAGGRQRHPGIVAIHAVGEHEGVHFLAQELVEGEATLASFLMEAKASPSLPKGYFRKVAGIVADVCDALQHAHDSGVIHRDIKPNNLLLTREDRPKVTDFGLAKIENALSLSKTGALMGTPLYMSPEQVGIRGVKIDKRTDIYSLGVTLYELLTLSVPFDGETSQEILKKVRYDEPQDPRRHNPRVPRDLAVICLMAMEKKPDFRYQTMSEFARDLRCFLDGEMIIAKPAGVGTKALKRIKRYPVVSGALALAVLAILALVIVVPWIRVSAERKARLEIESAWTETEEARLAEQKQKIAAEEETARKLAVNKFFQRLLVAPSPYYDGRDVKLIDVLERADKEIFAAFVDHPIVKCEIHQTIGNAYIGLGLYNSAKVHLETALALSLEQKGANHADTLRIRKGLGQALWEAGEISKALAQFETALPMASETFGEEGELTLGLKSDIGQMLKEQGKYEEAITTIEEVLQMRRKVLGSKSSVTLLTMSNLASALLAVNRRSEAKSLMEECLDGYEAICEADHPDLLKVRNNYCQLLEADEAEPLQRQVLEIRTEKLGRDHPDTVTAMNNLAASLLKQGKLTEGQELLEEGLTLLEEKLDERHPKTVKIRFHFAETLLMEKKYSAAEPILLQVYEDQCKILGEEHRDTLKTLSDLGCAMIYLNRTDEGIKLLRKVLDGAERTMGEDRDFTIKTRESLSNALLLQKKLAEAIPLLEKQIQLAKDGNPLVISSLTDKQIRYGSCLTVENRYQDAEDTFKEILARSPLQAKQREMATKFMVVLYTKWNKPRKANEYREQLSSLQEN